MDVIIFRNVKEVEILSRGILLWEKQSSLKIWLNVKSVEI